LPDLSLERLRLSADRCGRGSAPLTVALFSVLVVGEPLSRASQVAVACSGIMSLALTGGVDLHEERQALLYAL